MDSDPKPGERAWRQVEPVWGKINTNDEPREFLSQFRRVRPEVIHLFAAHWCLAEVCDGGFHQFCFNSAGVLAPEALVAFRAIGLVVWASLLEEAMQFFGDPYRRGQEERWERLGRAEVPGAQGEEWNRFCALDDRFYAWLHEDLVGGIPRLFGDVTRVVGGSEIQRSVPQVGVDGRPILAGNPEL